MLGKEIKMEKKTYVSAEVKLVDLTENDVIRTSGERPGIDLPDIDLAALYAGTPNSSEL